MKKQYIITALMNLATCWTVCMLPDSCQTLAGIILLAILWFYCVYEDDKDGKTPKKWTTHHRI